MGTESDTVYQMPPRLHDSEGAVRRVGVEVEFAGLDVDEASQLVARLFGGTPEREHRFGMVVRGTRFGDFRVELDARVLKEQRYKAFLERIGAPEPVQDAVEDAMEAVARTWLPSEIVSPPLPITDVHEMEVLRRALYEHNADGTKASVLYTFGFQLNPELPGRDADTLVRYLRAFLLLYDWLVDVSKIDFTRKLSSFIDPFPESYRKKVIDPAYRPDLDQLIDDYLADNPTRNRPLDMLPAFATMRHDKVIAAAKEHDQVKARPTFHYRLPNCCVDDPKWTFAQEWNRWVEVERLAEDPVRLESMARAYLAAGSEDGEVDPRAWSEQVAGWLAEAA